MIRLKKSIKKKIHDLGYEIRITLQKKPKQITKFKAQ
jgi:hypothetical protein